MKTVKEVSKISGVSVRTLHHYDAIGLLKPAKVTQAGYRLYDGAALARLQSILLFRQLQFPLKEIKEILDRPHFDYHEALKQQIALLELQHKHIGELIDYARKLEKGEMEMSFKAFDNSEVNQYKAEAKARWGETEAYKEYVQRQGGNDAASPEKLMKIFAEFGALRELPTEDRKVQNKVKELQECISDNFYTCTNEILAGLGQMYVADERFRQNIDCAGGDGTAEFVGRAIDVYCSK